MLSVHIYNAFEKRSEAKSVTPGFWRERKREKADIFGIIQFRLSESLGADPL